MCAPHVALVRDNKLSHPGVRVRVRGGGLRHGGLLVRGRRHEGQYWPGGAGRLAGPVGGNILAGVRPSWGSGGTQGVLGTGQVHTY